MITWSIRARRDLGRLDPDVATRIHRALQRYDDDRQGDVQKLQSRADEWRLRVGDWRLIFTLVDDLEAILVIRVLNRRDAYR
ncbi:MAG: type II toxin-antitoxin system RelE family toxin [Chloroflexota bacterium]